MANQSFRGAVATQYYRWGYTCEFCKNAVEKKSSFSARNSSMKKLIVVLLTCALAVADLCAACCEEQEIRVVTFGHYEQDNDPDNGPEPIEWIVLTQFGNHTLLLSLNCLDARCFNDAYGSAPWENCSLRSWLNDAFLNAAFTEEEQARIFDTNNANTMADGYPGLPAKGGNTTDKVFLLSYRELMTFADTITIPGATAYAEACCNPGSNDSASAWWLRSPGPDDHAALVLYTSGELNYCPTDLNRMDVRPALTVKLEG